MNITKQHCNQQQQQ